MSFPTEEIPDKDLLYLRVHKNNLNEKGEPHRGAYKERGNGMSTDWEKYSTPQETRNRAKSSAPKDNCVIHFVTGVLRSLNLDVTHSPEDDNRAHTDVKGKDKPIQKDVEIRAKLGRRYVWDIRLEDN